MPASTVPRRLPTVLVLDFWDSYTRNVLRLVHQIAAGFDFDGQDEWDCMDWQDRVLVLNVDSLSWCVHPLLLAIWGRVDRSARRDSFEHDILPHIDCVVLGPGPGTPHRQEDFSWPTRLIQQVGDRVPVFGLCLGLQGLATSFGGTVSVRLVQDNDPSADERCDRRWLKPSRRNTARSA